LKSLDFDFNLNSAIGRGSRCRRFAGKTTPPKPHRRNLRR
jgi:hypothetical protein